MKFSVVYYNCILKKHRSLKNLNKLSWVFQQKKCDVSFSFYFLFRFIIVLFLYDLPEHWASEGDWAF